MGQNYSIADIYLYTIATWLEGDGVDTAMLPIVMGHRSRMEQREAVKKVRAAYA